MSIDEINQMVVDGSLMNPKAWAENIKLNVSKFSTMSPVDWLIRLINNKDIPVVCESNRKYLRDYVLPELRKL